MRRPRGEINNHPLTKCITSVVVEFRRNSVDAGLCHRDAAVWSVLSSTRRSTSVVQKPQSPATEMNGASPSRTQTDIESTLRRPSPSVLPAWPCADLAGRGLWKVGLRSSITRRKQTTDLVTFCFALAYSVLIYVLIISPCFGYVCHLFNKRIYVCSRQGGPNWHIFVHQIFTNFQTSFTVRSGENL